MVGDQINRRRPSRQNNSNITLIRSATATTLQGHRKQDKASCFEKRAATHMSIQRSPGPSAKCDRLAGWVGLRAPLAVRTIPAAMIPSCPICNDGEPRGAKRGMLPTPCCRGGNGRRYCSAFLECLRRKPRDTLTQRPAGTCIARAIAQRCGDGRGGRVRIGRVERADTAGVAHATSNAHAGMEAHVGERG